MTVELGTNRDSSTSMSAQLRALLYRDELTFLIEAHNALSAVIVAEAGFEAIWASGLSISAAMGLRDRNEASYTQVLEVVELMADRVNVPIMLDGDTGFGDFNNIRRLVRKLCQRGIAGVCFEDKQFPKRNSFIGERQQLASVREFCGKLRSAKDAQTDKDFVVVARTEALIAGAGMNEALFRAEAYRDAGADAVLVHSKRSDADEILEFMRRWDGRCPIVIVPTTYSSTPTGVIAAAGVSAVIWANHSLRASVRAIQQLTRRIREDESVGGVEPSIATVAEIFRLTDEASADTAEALYT